MPPNIIKAKVGSGGLSDAIIERAQDLLENNSQDFAPLAEIYLEKLQKGIDYIVSLDDPNMLKDESVVGLIVFPAMQLKSNGGMFHYPLVTRVADCFLNFIEAVERTDPEILEIAQAFHTAVRVVVAGKIQGSGGVHGDALVMELNNACMRYIEKYKDTIDLDKG